MLGDTLKARGATTVSWWCGAAGMVAVGVAIILGNSAVLMALRRVRRAPSHYPLASLAAADLLVGLFVFPIAAARELFVFHLSWAVCTCWSTLDVLCCTASILSLCALGWERWCGITAPLARARRTRRSRILAGLVWPVALVVALPTAFVPSPRHFLPGEIPKPCTVNTNVGYVFFSILFSFYLPACVMVVLYAKIVIALASLPPIRAHQGRKLNADTQEIPVTPNLKPTNFASKMASPTAFIKQKLQRVTAYLSPKGTHLNMPGASTTVKEPTPKKNSASPGCIQSRQRKATRSIVMLMALFLVCWTPFFVMLPIDSLCECVWDAAWQWCTWLGYANSALNPIVYAAASPSVRRVLHASITTTTSSTRTNDIPLTPTTRRI